MIPRHFQIAVALLLLGIFGSAAYIIRLRQIEEDRIQRRIDSRPVTAPVSGPMQTAVLYLAFDEDTRLRREERRMNLPVDPADRTQELLRAVLAEYAKKPTPHQVGYGADIRDVFLVNDQLIVVDLNKEFVEGHPSGVMTEMLTLQSLAKTVKANLPNVQQIKFLVNGEERDTLAGHADIASVHKLSSFE